MGWRRGFAVAAREVLNGLRLAVFDDDEIVLRQVGDEIALLVHGADTEGHEIDAGAERRALPRRRRQSSRGATQGTQLVAHSAPAGVSFGQP